MVNNANFSPQTVSYLDNSLKKMVRQSVELEKKTESYGTAYKFYKYLTFFFKNPLNFIFKYENAREKIKCQIQNESQKKIISKALKIMETYKQAMEIELCDVNMQRYKNVEKNLSKLMDFLENVNEDFWEKFKIEWFQNYEILKESDGVKNTFYYYDNNGEKIILDLNQEEYHSFEEFYTLLSALDKVYPEEMNQIIQLIRNKKIEKSEKFNTIKGIIKRQIETTQKIKIKFEKELKKLPKVKKEKSDVEAFCYFVKEQGAIEEMNLINEQIGKAADIWRNAKLQIDTDFEVKLAALNNFYEKVANMGFARDCASGQANVELFIKKNK